MSTLLTVDDYIDDVRVLLQDTIHPHRYGNESLLVALNVTLLEARRVRPDLFVFDYHDEVPAFDAVDSTEVEMEPPFRLAIVYGTTAHALARDQEDVQDQRATSFMQVFYHMLTGIAVTPIAGGPPPGAR